MSIITEFNKFNQKSLMDKLSEELSHIFKYVKISNKTITASSLLDRSGKPLVRIDSKQPITAIMLKLGDGSIEISSIVNSSGVRGLATKVVNVILSLIDTDMSIIIDQDVSGGFWDSVINKYPEYKWIKL